MHGHGDIRLRTENCCDVDGCKRPVHIGSLCASCFLAATPARRQVELDADEARLFAPPPPAMPLVSDEGVAWLEDLWAA